MWQCSSIQFDFNLPQRFNVSYVNKNGKKQIPFIIHRVLFGSLERFIGILLENYGMDLPLDLQSEQMRLILIHQDNLDYALKVKDYYFAKGIRVQVDKSSQSLNSKIKKALNLNVPIIGVIGDQEVKNEEISIRIKVLKNIVNAHFSKVLDMLREYPTRLVS